MKKCLERTPRSAQEEEEPDKRAGGVGGRQGVEEGDGGAGEQPGQQQLARQPGTPANTNTNTSSLVNSN